MRFAFVNGVRCEPAPGLYGKCCLCDSDMISKCGQYVRWHWAHKGRTSCDPWHESETDWHRYWKDAFPVEQQEVVHIDARTGEKHIADVKTPGGIVVEVQHSPIAEIEVQSREDFYRKMIWIIDARHLTGWFLVGMSYDLASYSPMTYQIEWWGIEFTIGKVVKILSVRVFRRHEQRQRSWRRRWKAVDLAFWNHCSGGKKGSCGGCWNST